MLSMLLLVMQLTSMVVLLQGLPERRPYCLKQLLHYVSALFIIRMIY